MEGGGGGKGKGKVYLESTNAPGDEVKNIAFTGCFRHIETTFFDPASVFLSTR